MNNSNLYEKVKKVISARIKFFHDKHFQSHEAKKLTGVLYAIQELIPPENWEEIHSKEVRESPEQVLRKYFKTKDNTDIHWMPEVIQAMQEYALQYQSVPVSEYKEMYFTEKELKETAQNICIERLDQIKNLQKELISEEEKNIYREQGWDACNKLHDAVGHTMPSEFTKETINNENIYIRDYIHLDCLFYHSLQDQYRYHPKN